MLGRTYERENCSAARALELVGERWSLLIMRDALFRRATRFGDFQQRLGIAPNILAARLESFVNYGLMERRPYSQHPEHYEYLLTQQGRELQPVIIALSQWGDRWAAPAGPPAIYTHATCGTQVELRINCPHCGELSNSSEVATTPGPGA